jgi:hypothetical protein
LAEPLEHTALCDIDGIRADVEFPRDVAGGPPVNRYGHKCPPRRGFELHLGLQSRPFQKLSMAVTVATLGVMCVGLAGEDLVHGAPAASQFLPP